MATLERCPECGGLCVELVGGRRAIDVLPALLRAMRGVERDSMVVVAVAVRSALAIQRTDDVWYRPREARRG